MAHVYARPHHMLQTEEEVLGIVEDDPSTSTREIARQLYPASDWTYFKAATADDGPYSLAMHMSRAVKLGKTSIIRKIAHVRPHLLETENKENKTPLIQAVESGDPQIVQLLIILGANINNPLQYNKRTALMVAVYRNRLQIASTLIEKGADIHATDVNGLNVLHYAVDSNHIDNVKFALQAGICVNSRDNQGWTPLVRAGMS
ncbi:hypothetical protein NQ317_013558 [Molorchus minor]|uniref:Uncharacterized protein n=1 Tax=Molorchus minor TaxID=1323400 RepID=A0ABQ9JIZ1_9CUCU|nr:hypothetical protein NQ317_013558 [Molorchus minor]